MGKLRESSTAGYIAGGAGMVLVTAVCALLREHINEMTVALSMLLVTLFVSAVWGRWPGLAASVEGVTLLNYYFLPPIYTFTIEDSKNWVALGAFFVTALTAGQLSTWAKQRAAEAEASRTQARAASTYNRSLLEATLTPLMTVGSDGRINDVNAAAETATGLGRAKLIGSEFATHFTEVERARAASAQVLSGDLVRGWSLDLVHSGGHTTSVLLDASLYRDSEGNVIGMVVSAKPVGTYAGNTQEPPPHSLVAGHLKFLVKFAALFSLAVGLLSIAGLAFGIVALKSITPDGPTIKMNTAVCLVLLGVSLWLVRGVKKSIAGLIAALLTALAGLLTIVECLFGWNAGIDQMLYREPAAEALRSVRPGLMSGITATDFLLLGLALLLVDRSFTWRSRRWWPAHYLASLSAVLAIFGVLGYLLRTQSYHTTIALQTAVTLLLVSLGVLCVRLQRGFPALVASSTAGGALTRRLLPGAVVIPIAMGAFALRALLAGWISDWGAVTLMIVAMMVLLGAFSVWNGYIVNRGDLERERAERILERRQVELSEAERLAHIGSWWRDPKRDSVIWSAGLSQLALRDTLLPPPSWKEHLAAFTPESASRFEGAVEAAIATGKPFELELEFVRTDGVIRQVTARGEVERDSEGQIALLRGTVHDVTERKRAENEVRTLARLQKKAADEILDLYNNAPCGYHSLDPDGVFLRVNDTELAWLGYTREELIGKRSFADLLTPDSQRIFRENFPKFKEQGVVRDLEFEMLRRDGSVLPVLLSATAITDSEGKYTSSRSTIYDVTARKKAENEIRMLARLQSVVADLGERALRGAPLTQMLDDAASQVAQALGVEYCKILELLPNREALLMRAGFGWKAGYVGHATVGLGADSQAGYTLQSGEPVVVEDLDKETRFAGTALLHEHNVASGASVVIATSEGPYGVLSAHSRQRRSFSPDQINFLQAVANVLGSLIDRQRAEARLWRVNQAQRVLSKCNEALIRATEESALLQQICSLIVEEAGYRMCWVGRAEPDEAKSVRPVAQAGFEAGYLATLNITWADTERGCGPTGTCIRTQTTIVSKQIAGDPRMIPWRAEALKRGYNSSVSIPLVVNGETFGALMIYAAEPDGFGSQEVALLSELASDLAFGIGTLRTRAERNRVLHELREKEEHVRLLLNSTAEAICGVDPKGNCTWVNQAAVKMLGYSGPDQILGKNLHNLTHYRKADGIPLPLEECHAYQALVHGDYAHVEDEVMWRADGTFFPVEYWSHPMHENGNTIGAVVTFLDITERRRAQSENRVLYAELEQRVAARTAELRASNQELTQVREREAQIGARIQQNILLDPAPQDVPGLAVAALTVPSQRIDGDFYIFLKHPNDSLDVIVGDVMGKGIPAALLAAATKVSFLKALTHLTALEKPGELPEPRDIVTLAHAEVGPHLIHLDSFVTLCYVRLDVAKRAAELVDCGHTGLVHWHHANGTCKVLHGDNLPLGVREGEIYQQSTVLFEAGDLLLFFSDGITEARNAAGELFGVDRLVEYVRSHATLEPPALVESIRQTVCEFCGAAPLSDDLTSVAIRVQEKHAPMARAEMEISSDLADLRHARAFVREFCRKAPGPPLDEDHLASLELAVNEAASNIMKHAYHGRVDQPIHLEGEAWPDYISIRLHHLGDPFDPSMAPVVDDRRESGRGAYIISQSVDQVRYYRDERGRNCVALTKNRSTRRNSNGNPC